MAQVSDFKVMGEMASQNLDIRMFPTVLRGQLTKKGGEITMGVNAQTLPDIAIGKVYCMLLVLDKTQFDETKKP